MKAAFTLPVQFMLRRRVYLCAWMGRLGTFATGLIGLLPLFAAAPAFAAPATPNKNSTATALIAPPASLRKLEDLNFGCLIVTGVGTAVLNPNTETVTTTGGVTKVGSPATCPAYSALFEAVSPIKGVVIIRLPKITATLQRVGGTETMTAGAWTLDGSANRNVPAKETWAFKVGGTLFVNANQAEGLYVGTFTVDVQYP
jgi:hypothetical protein